ncbi:hypothetical protein EV1_022529 [Malus domestica]
MIHLVLFTFLADSRSDLRCSKTSNFVHQHLAPSVGINTKSYVAFSAVAEDSTTLTTDDCESPSRMLETTPKEFITFLP